MMCTCLSFESECKHSIDVHNDIWKSKCSLAFTICHTDAEIIKIEKKNEKINIEDERKKNGKINKLSSAFQNIHIYQPDERKQSQTIVIVNK